MDPSGTSGPLYPDAYKFANNSGISLLDFPLNTAIRDVFASNNAFYEIDTTINAENTNYTYPNDLVTFFDSHDESRFLTLNNNQNRLQEAMAFLLTGRGIPIILYGDEQYLFNNSTGSDGNPGTDPYNRVWMSSFSTTTNAYKLIAKLAGLRQSNDAIGYGTWKQRWINNDVYIYERQFFNDVVLVAINKNDSTSYRHYQSLYGAACRDVHGLSRRPARRQKPDGQSQGAAAIIQRTTYSIPPASVSVWQYQVNATTPEVGSIGPHVGQPGMTVTIAGDGFGTSTALYSSGPPAATIQSWSNTRLHLPSQCDGGHITCNSMQHRSSGQYNCVYRADCEAHSCNVHCEQGQSNSCLVTTFLSQGVRLNWATGERLFRRLLAPCSIRIIRTGS